MGLALPQLNDSLTSFSFGQHRITNFEMETAAIYGLGKMLGHHCLSLNAIVANRVNRSFSSNSEDAVKKLIEHTLSVLAESV
jgi:uridine phosphorylase